MTKYIYIPLIIFAISSCESGPCITKSGDKITVRRILKHDPTNIYLYDNLNLEIIIDSINFIDVFAGSNLQDKIITKSTEDNLILRNDNSCAQFRAFDPDLKVQLHVKNIESIYYSGIGDINMLNMLEADSNYAEDFKFTAEHGAGIVSLNINRNVTLECDETYSKITLSNNIYANTLKIISNGTAWIHADKFLAWSVHVDNNSTGDCILNVGSSLKYSISNIGNIKYYGNPNPAITVLNHSGKGSLIQLD